MKEKITRFFERLSEKITYRHWIAIAAAASVLLGLIVFVGLSGSEDEEKAPPPDTVKVVVAKQDIAPKTILKETMLEQREVPSYMVPEEAVKDVSEVVNRPAKVQILKDDIVTTRRVLMDISMAGFTGEIPPECRAITIGISDITGVAGFAKPGDYVDIMLITKGDDRMVGRVVLQDVQLLAINNITEGPQKMESASSGDVISTGIDNKEKDSKEEVAAAEPDDKPISNLATATLALLPSDALKLITESQEGTLYLSLRPYKPRDKFTTDTRYTHYSTIKSSKPAAAPAAPAAQGAPQAGYSAPAPAAAPFRSSGSVEVIRGTTSTREGA